jgi:hypothetical protein
MKPSNYILLFVAFISIIQILFVLNLDFATYIYATLSYLMIYFLVVFYKKKIKKKLSFNIKLLLNCYLFLGIVAITKGVFSASNYWEWKQIFLITGPVMLLPLVTFIGQNKTVVQFFFLYYVKYALPISIIVFFLSKSSNSTDGFGRYLSPIYFIILLFPFVSNKWKIYIFVFALLSFVSDLGARSNLIRILVATIFMLLFFIKKITPNITYKFFHFSLFFIPILFFLLAVFNVFNVFKMDNYVKGDYETQETNAAGEKVGNNLKADTRTFLYVDVINSVLKRNTWLSGEGAAGGYETKSFSSLGTRGRMGSEVGILNVFIYLGILGVIGFSLIFFSASFLAIYRSNNYLIKIIGLFVAFRWTYSWVEEFSNFDMNYFFLWLMIGFCFSKSVREMNDIEMKHWVLGIFERKKSLQNIVKASSNL